MTITITPEQIYIWLAFLLAGIAATLLINYIPWKSVRAAIDRRLNPPPAGHIPSVVRDYLILAALSDSLPVQQWIVRQVANELYPGFETTFNKALKAHGAKFPLGQQHPLVTPSVSVTEVVDKYRKLVDEAAGM